MILNTSTEEQLVQHLYLFSGTLLRLLVTVPICVNFNVDTCQVGTGLRPSFHFNDRLPKGNYFQQVLTEVTF